MQKSFAWISIFIFGTLLFIKGSSGFHFHREERTYHEASQFCKARGMKLAVVRTRNDLAQASKACGPSPSRKCWTGAIGNNGHIKYGDDPGICVAIGASSRTWLQIGDCHRDRLSFLCQKDVKCRVQLGPNLRYLQGPCGANLVPGRRAYFECDEGYEMIGSNSVKCGEGGQLESYPPKCAVIQTKRIEMCPKLDNLRHASSVIHSKGNLVGSQVTVRCRQGARLKGSNKLTCLRGGRWSAQVPTCTATQCVNLMLANGRVTVSNGNRHGSVASFTCYSGYNLQGSSRSTCQQNGAWQPEPALCVEPRCPALRHPVNGHKQHDGGYAVGAQTRFRCFDGYQMDGSPTTTCKADASWSTPPPTCYKCENGVSRIDVCEHPAIGDRITFECSGHACDVDVDENAMSFDIVSEAFQGSLEGSGVKHQMSTSFEKRGKKWIYSLSMDIKNPTAVGTYSCSMEGDHKTKKVFLQPVEEEWWGNLICQHDSIEAKSSSAEVSYVRVNGRVMLAGEGGVVTLPPDLRGRVKKAQVCFCDKRFYPQGCVNAKCPQ